MSIVNIKFSFSLFSLQNTFEGNKNYYNIPDTFTNGGLSSITENVKNIHNSVNRMGHNDKRPRPTNLKA